MNDPTMPATARNLKITKEKEIPGHSGYLPLVLVLVTLGIAAWGLTMLKQGTYPDGLGIILAIGGAVLALGLTGGFYILQPNQAAALNLFGDYRGTDRESGLRWTWPWMARKKVSVRVHNVTSEKLKINDLRGNPVIIAANVVWRITDTGQALFDVDDYTEFVDIQIESALRHVGAQYPYDDFEHDETTLRGDADVVSDEMQRELQERVAAAGVTIDECRLTHLAYAQEIAQAMLRRQQAEAVIAARARLVEGAVTMVEDALGQLSAKGVVDLDAERRAAMVSNLMVVLCSERDTQPVVNTGSLYQ